MKYKQIIFSIGTVFMMTVSCATVPVKQKDAAQVTACVPDHSLFCKKESSSQRTKRPTGDRPSGPSDATMRQSVVGGGYLSGGHFSSSMGAGATRGHGHR